MQVVDKKHSRGKRLKTEQNLGTRAVHCRCLGKGGFTIELINARLSKCQGSGEFPPEPVFLAPAASWSAGNELGNWPTACQGSTSTCCTPEMTTPVATTTLAALNDTIELADTNTHIVTPANAEPDATPSVEAGPNFSPTEKKPLLMLMLQHTSSSWSNRTVEFALFLGLAAVYKGTLFQASLFGFITTAFGIFTSNYAGCPFIAPLEI